MVRWVFFISFIIITILIKVLNLKLNFLLYIIFVAALITLIFEEELWHKRICPYGTLLSISSGPARYGVNITPEKCIACGLCEKICPNKAIKNNKMNNFTINNIECLTCFKCQDVCSVNAIKFGKI